MSAAKTTTDHKEIRKWVEKRKGKPSRVAATAPGKTEAKKGSGGILRIDFAKPDESLETIEWDEFFRIFDEHKLAFLYQEEGGSRFHKFVSRNRDDR